jgi:hypothetical protein
MMNNKKNKNSLIYVIEHFIVWFYEKRETWAPL